MYNSRKLQQNCVSVAMLLFQEARAEDKLNLRFSLFTQKLMDVTK